MVKIENLAWIDKECSLLPLSEYRFWHDAILEDNSEMVSQILFTECRDHNEKHRLLNGEFVDDVIELKIETKMIRVWSEERAREFVDTDITQPLGLAVIHGSMNVIKVFCDNGIDMLQINKQGNNIINCLIAMSVTNSKLEQKMRGVYAFLRTMLTTDELRALLDHQRLPNINCLEECTLLGAFGLLIDILETPGLYIQKRSGTGVSDDVWLDVTEYESEKSHIIKRRLSPLQQLGDIARSQVALPTVHECIFHPFFQTWLSAKIKCSLPFVLALMGIHFFY